MGFHFEHGVIPIAYRVLSRVLLLVGIDWPLYFDFDLSPSFHC